MRNASRTDPETTGVDDVRRPDDMGFRCVEGEEIVPAARTAKTDERAPREEDPHGRRVFNP